MLRSGAIQCGRPVRDSQIQPSSLDLRLSGHLYRVRASFLPGEGQTVTDALAQGAGHQMRRVPLDTAGGAVLETGCVYLAPVEERLALPPGLSGRANPKSSTGRIDVFTRLVTDEGRRFDRVPDGYHGPLWLEICPRTFPVVVRKGDRLAQLRLCSGAPPSGKEVVLSVDLCGTEGRAPGWRARPHAPLLDLGKLAAHRVEDYWEPVHPVAGRIVLEPGAFYILASREAVAVPQGEAAEMAAISPELGEFRAHYAGFFDPGFGLGASSRAVLEVRSRDVPFVLEDGQPVAKLVYAPLQSEPEAGYGGASSNYQGQGLRLAKWFAA